MLNQCCNYIYPVHVVLWNNIALYRSSIVVIAGSAITARNPDMHELPQNPSVRLLIRSSPPSGPWYMLVGASAHMSCGWLIHLYTTCQHQFAALELIRQPATQATFGLDITHFEVYV
jgi:hypothetical protein